MYMYMYVYMYVYVYVYMYMYMYMYVFELLVSRLPLGRLAVPPLDARSLVKCMCMHVYMHIHMCSSTPTRQGPHVDMHACVYACMRICMHAHVYVRPCVHVCTWSLSSQSASCSAVHSGKVTFLGTVSPLILTISMIKMRVAAAGIFGGLPAAPYASW